MSSTFHRTKEWLAYTYQNRQKLHNNFNSGYASTVVIADTQSEAYKQAKEMFGEWAKVEFKKHVVVKKED